MNSRVRLLSIGGLLLVVGALLFLRQPSSSAVLYTGAAQVDSGPLRLEVIVDPPVARPGDTVRLTARVSNRAAGLLTPSVTLRLPRGLSSDAYTLPAGATLNLQENRIDWQPVVGGGQTQSFSLDVVVETTDVLIPEQSVVAEMRHQGDEQSAQAQIWLGIPPLIGEMLPQHEAAVGQPIQLQAQIAGPGPLSAVWDLGDGRHLDLADPVVIFPAAGEYDVTLRVSNPAGVVSRRAAVTILPNPVASFRPDDDAPAIDQPVTFVNASGGQPPLTVFWDFGDGTTLMGEQQPSHTYRQGGAYRVRLTVENAFGRSEAVWDVTVGDAPVVEMSLAEGAAVGRPLTGQASSTDGATRFLWDMGDGRRHEGATVSHLYRRPGDYYVTVVADNGFGQAQVGRWVHVDAGPTTLFLPLATYLNGSGVANLSAEAALPSDLDPVATTPGQVYSLSPMTFPTGTTAAEELYAYLNAARAQFGLPPLDYNQTLSAAAQGHAQDKAQFPANPHVGSDGTTSAERYLRVGYGGGFAGEATAWGFADARLAVEFWMNSDSHRALVLNRLATDVGVGYVVDFATENVWHWTAEFGVSYGAPVRPVVRLQEPATELSALDNETVNYSWLWPQPLAAGERFTVYVLVGNQTVALGSVAAPVYGSRYILSADALSTMGPAGLSPTAYRWLVRLEDGLGNTLAESEQRAIAFAADPAAPTPAPTVAIVTATPVGPTITPSPTVPPTAVAPTLEPPPVVVTATPPPPTPEPTTQPAEPPPGLVTATPQPSPTSEP
ncbi:MAG: PKD domain-containing protein [Anaerolineae bacterium]|nr:PKD domain-containing protein [Anaerolineae bacterium]